MNGDNSNKHKEIDPEKITELGDPRKSARAADCIDVKDKYADDFAESEGHDCEVIAAQTQRWNPNGQSGDARKCCSCNHT